MPTLGAKARRRWGTRICGQDERIWRVNEMSEAKRMGFATRAIHDGQAPEGLTGAVNVPIFLTSTYQQEEIGKNKGHEYARLTNPTRDALEESLCSLEGGTSAD